MDKLIDEFIIEFKKLKNSDNLFDIFVMFVDKCLTTRKDDKYKMEKLQIMEYIFANKESIKLRLIQS